MKNRELIEEIELGSYVVHEKAYGGEYYIITCWNKNGPCTIEEAELGTVLSFDKDDKPVKSLNCHFNVVL